MSHEPRSKKTLRDFLRNTLAGSLYNQVASRKKYPTYLANYQGFFHCSHVLTCFTSTFVVWTGSGVRLHDNTKMFSANSLS